MSLATLGWVFTFGVLLHNLEEALYLPAWSSNAGRWYRPVASNTFRTAIIILSMILVTVTAFAATAEAGGTLAYIMAGYCLAMILNAVAPHLLLTIKLGRPMPGTLTAIAFNVPLGLYYLRQSLLRNHIHAQTFLWAGPLVTLTFLLLIPLLFAICKRL
jgi:hypothetical protein